MKVQLRESCKFAESLTDSGELVVRIIKAGKGSSGTYTPELLESSYHYWENSLSYSNHPADGDPTSRSFLDVVGTIGETWYDPEDQSVYGKYKPLTSYRDTIMELKDKLGLSIFTTGTARKLSDGSVLVESFDEVDEYRSVDVVVAAGAGGSLAPFMESLRKEDDRKENTMELEQVANQLSELGNKFDKFLEAQAAEKQARADEEKNLVSVEEAVDKFAAASEQIDKAEITESQKEALKAKAKTGADIAEDLTREVETFKQISESLKPAGNEGGGYNIKESKSATPDSFVIGGWN